MNKQHCLSKVVQGKCVFLSVDRRAVLSAVYLHLKTYRFCWFVIPKKQLLNR